VKTKPAASANRVGIPHVPSLHVDRPRLVAELDRSVAVAAPLVLVSGPAGSGKTSLLAEWVHTGHGPHDPVGWVTFEDEDTRLWPPLLECLTRLGLPAGDAAPDLLLGRTRLQALAAAVAGSGRRWILVLDGYELKSPELAAEVSYLLDHAGGHLRLVFAARVDPVLPLYRYRLDDTIVEVRAADLAFSDDEATELLRRCGVELGAEAAHDLTSRLGGWAAGLRFAARALVRHEHPESSVAAVVALDADINEYLLVEVLRGLEPEARQLLMRTCIPDCLTPELAEELAGPAAGRGLAELAHTNTFIEPVPDRPGSYRYFPFFRDLLRAQLAYEEPDTAAALHRRAAAWLRTHGMARRSLAQLATGSLWSDVAAQLVEDLLVAHLLLGPDERLVEIARRIPADVPDAAACVVRATLALAASDPVTCADELARAREAGPSGREPGGGSLDLSLAVVDMARACRADEAEVADRLVDEACRARDRAHSPGVGGPELEGLVELAGAVIALRRGDLRRASAALAGVEQLPGLPARFHATALGYHALAEALEGRLTRARGRAIQSLSLVDDAHVLPENRHPAASVALALVALERDDLEAARQHIASARTCRSLAHDPVCRTITSGVLAHLETGPGPESPRTRLESVYERTVTHDPWLAGWLRMRAAELAVVHGRADQALLALDPIERDTGLGDDVVAAAAYAEQGRQRATDESLARARDAARPLPVEVTRLLLEGVQESRRHSPRHATPLVERALRLAAQEQVRRPFREATPAVRHLLAGQSPLLDRHRWLSGPSLPAGATISVEPARPPVRRTTTSAPHRPPVARPHEDPTDVRHLVMEPLTAKEREVLGHLEELLTTEEMAEKMFVSVNTIRTHVRSILRKLGVNRRNSAVRRARELGMLGPRPPVA